MGYFTILFVALGFVFCISNTLLLLTKAKYEFAKTAERNQNTQYAAGKCTVTKGIILFQPLSTSLKPKAMPAVDLLDGEYPECFYGTIVDKIVANKKDLPFNLTLSPDDEAWYHMLMNVIIPRIILFAIITWMIAMFVFTGNLCYKRFKAKDASESATAEKKTTTIPPPPTSFNYNINATHSKEHKSPPPVINSIIENS